MYPHPLTNWIPYSLTYDPEGQWVLSWIDLQNRSITEPFFDQTIQISKWRNRERSVLSSLSDPDFLIAAAQGIPHLNPTAFIFHVSRCGSTLLTQAFCEDEENIVISEAPLLDEILRANEKDPNMIPEQQEKWFKAALNMMGQQRNFKESSYTIKLDSWHLHFYTQLRNWFPVTPFIFIFRKPEQVLASQEKRRGIHSVPGIINKALLGIDLTKAYFGDFNRYTADVIEQYYLRIINAHQEGHPLNFFADYGDGMRQMIFLYSNITGIMIKDEAKLKTRLTFHSKSPNEPFKEDIPPDSKFTYEHLSRAYRHLKELTASENHIPSCK